MPQRNQPNILVAALREDLPMIRAAFERVAIMDGVRYLHDGDELLGYLQGRKKYANRTEHPLPDFLFVDLTLPVKNGFHVLRWMRDHPVSPQPRVIVLATSENLRDVNDAYRLGAKSFVTKPIDLDDFKNTVSAMHDDWTQSKARA